MRGPEWKDTLGLDEKPGSKKRKRPPGIRIRGGWILGIAFLFLCILSIYSIREDQWVLLAIPAGFLFGFFLQRGDLCGASACSEVLLFRSWAKLGGFWICIMTFMYGFAIADAAGWVESPGRPLAWLNLLAGGALFGTGMVLAGGCVTGTLFKVGTGNLNSLAAVIGIPVGVGMVREGWLAPLYASLSHYTLYSRGHGAMTFTSLTGVSYPVWAALFGAATLAVMGVSRLSKVRASSKREGPIPPSPDSPVRPTPSLYQKIFIKPWKPWAAGIAIGLLALPVYMLSCRSGFHSPLGTTGGIYSGYLVMRDAPIALVTQDECPSLILNETTGNETTGDETTGRETVENATTGNGIARNGTMGNEVPGHDASGHDASGHDASGRGASDETPADESRPVVYLWLPLLCAGLMIGSFVAARISGTFRVLPKPRSQVVIALLGGCMVGIGAALADGCFYGNIVSGCALLNASGFLFALVVVIAAMITTRLYLIGGLFMKSK